MPYLLFPLPDAIVLTRDKYQADAYYSNLFEGNNLKIAIYPTGKYIPIFEGNATEYRQGYKEVFESVGMKRYGFEVRIQDGRDAIYRILEALIADAYSNSCDSKTIECWDYVEDEGEELGYKIRYGRIADLKKEGGVFPRQRLGKLRKLSQGLSFQFLEKELRFFGR